MSMRPFWTWLAPLAALAACAEAAPDNAAVFDRAWALTAEKYWDRTMAGLDWAAVRDRHRPQAIAAPDERALYGVINAMLGTLKDSHAFALSPTERRRAGAAAEGGAGFGLDLEPAKDGWTVAGVAADGPAARAGVEIGWTLVAIDGRPPDGDRQYGAGDRAVLSFRDDGGRVRALPLVGAVLDEAPVRRGRMLAGGVLLLAFDGFDPGTDDWIAGEIATHHPRGLILDLRTNDGGASDVLDRVAGLFFAEKRTVLRLVRRRETVENTIGAGGEDHWGGPLALLIGPRSASAAEALAAMIDEAGRGMTIGARTAGHLTGATDHRLPDGGLLSTAEYDVRTPAGRRLEGVGLTPRIAVTPTLAERRRGADPVAECARTVVLGGKCTAHQ